jgi:hypothetical protein
LPRRARRSRPWKSRPTPKPSYKGFAACGKYLDKQIGNSRCSRTCRWFRSLPQPRSLLGADNATVAQTYPSDPCF